MTAAGDQGSCHRESGSAPALWQTAAGCLFLALLTYPTHCGADATAGDDSPQEVLNRAGPDTAATTAGDRANREPGTEKAKLTPRGALWRSALIPGWGQLRNGRYFKAVLFSGAAAAFAAASISETRNLGRVEASERQAAAGRRNTRLLLFMATATFSALDAYVDAHLADFGLSLSGSQDLAADLSLTWAFQ